MKSPRMNWATFTLVGISRNTRGTEWMTRRSSIANGVYLYRVITRLNGDAIEQRESGADPYIINGWGKMYLMR